MPVTNQFTTGTNSMGKRSKKNNKVYSTDINKPQNYCINPLSFYEEILAHLNFHSLDMTQTRAHED